MLKAVVAFVLAAPCAAFVSTSLAPQRAPALGALNFFGGQGKGATSAPSGAAAEALTIYRAK
jgi:hypothetical protein